MKNLSLFVLAGALALFSGASLAEDEVKADVSVGDDAPAFVATTLDGKKFDLSALKGKVVVIHFWATWCKDCHFEMPALEAVWRSRHNEGLEALAVSVDAPDARKHVNDVMHFFSYPAAMLGEVSKNEFITEIMVPLTYVIGKDGKIRDIIVLPSSLSNENEFGGKIKEYLKEKEEKKTDEKTGEKADAKAETKKDEKQ